MPPVSSQCMAFVGHNARPLSQRPVLSPSLCQAHKWHLVVCALARPVVRPFIGWPVAVPGCSFVSISLLSSKQLSGSSWLVPVAVLSVLASHANLYTRILGMPVLACTALRKYAKYSPTAKVLLIGYVQIKYRPLARPLPTPLRPIMNLAKLDG